MVLPWQYMEEPCLQAETKVYAIPVAVSGTFLVMMLLATVFMRLPAMIMGTKMATRRYSECVPAWRMKRTAQERARKTNITLNLFRFSLCVSFSFFLSLSLSLSPCLSLFVFFSSSLSLFFTSPQRTFTLYHNSLSLLLSLSLSFSLSLSHFLPVGGRRVTCLLVTFLISWCP